MLNVGDVVLFRKKQCIITSISSCGTFHRLDGSDTGVRKEALSKLGSRLMG